MSSNLAEQGWLTDPVESGAAAGFGVYLHVPFCAHRCGYCDFATFATGQLDDPDAIMDRYVAALRADLQRAVAAGPTAHAPDAGAAERAAPGGGWPTVTSIFVGGGTPTLLPADDLAGLVELVHAELDVAPDAEVSVECNPETASVELFERLAAAGVNRVSMGAQSFTPAVLETLERGHGRDRPLIAVEQARAGGIAEVNLDLIFGTPGETDDDWVDTLRQVQAVGTDHVSAYALTVHQNTPFGTRVASGTMRPPDDDVQRDRFDRARDLLGAGGFDHYEVSNWARRPGLRSDHNVLYWRHGNYLGVGVGAHAHLEGRRWWAPRSIDRYLTAVEDGQHPVAGEEVLDVEERAAERLLLGLRLREGLHPSDVPPLEPLAVQDAADAGLLQLSCGRFQTTDEGWFLLDETVGRLL